MSESRPSARLVAVTVAVSVALGLVAAAAWSWLAPTGPVVARDGHLFAVDDPELAAGQDVLFALVTGLAGLAVGAWVVVRSADRPVQRLLSAVPAGALGSLVAWQVGGALGPNRPADPGSTSFPAPIELHALGLLALWPAVTATVVFVGLLLAPGLSRSRSRR